MIDALIAGRIFGKPESRTARNGSAFVTAKARIPTSSGEAQFVNVVAFRESVRTALLAPSDGDSVALAGELKLTAYLGRDGQPHPGVDLVASQLLTEYSIIKRRKAFQDANGQPQAPRDDAPAPAAAEPEFDDALPF